MTRVSARYRRCHPCSRRDSAAVAQPRQRIGCRMALSRVVDDDAETGGGADRLDMRARPPARNARDRRQQQQAVGAAFSTPIAISGRSARCLTGAGQHGTRPWSRSTATRPPAAPRPGSARRFTGAPARKQAGPRRSRHSSHVRTVGGFTRTEWSALKGVRERIRGAADLSGHFLRVSCSCPTPYVCDCERTRTARHPTAVVRTVRMRVQANTISSDCTIGINGRRMRGSASSPGFRSAVKQRVVIVARHTMNSSTGVCVRT